MSTTKPPVEDWYRARELLYREIGMNQWLVESPSSGARSILSSHELDLLLSCDSFATIREHLEKESPADVASELEKLEYFAKTHLLLGFRDLEERLRDFNEMDGKPRRIGTIAVLTKDRVPALKRCLDSYARNVRESGRSTEILVVDGSPQVEMRNSNVEVLRTVGRHYSINVRYASRLTKDGYADRLAKEAGVSPTLTRFALSESPGISHDEGTNRNAILLDQAGKQFLGADDDTTADLFCMEGQLDAPIHFTSEEQPLRVLLFQNRAEGERRVPRAQADLLEIHERWLGRPLSHCALQALSVGVSKDQFSGRFGPLLKHLCQGQGKVRITVSGIFGDSGANNPRFYLWDSPHIRDQLLDGEASYESKVTSREVLIAPPFPLISEGAFTRTTCLAFDCREILPPFLPVFRGTDLLFGGLLRLASGKDYVAHVPTAILHSPIDHRQNQRSDLWLSGLSTRLFDLFTLALGPFTSCGLPVERSTEQGLVALGHWFMELGQLEWAEFEMWMRSQLWTQIGLRIQKLEATVKDHGGSPSYWSQDILRFLDALLERSLSEDHVIPADLLAATGHSGVRDATLSMFRQYGELLAAWPTIFRAAEKLSLKGEQLGQPVYSSGD